MLNRKKNDDSKKARYENISSAAELANDSLTGVFV